MKTSDVSSYFSYAMGESVGTLNLFIQVRQLNEYNIWHAQTEKLVTKPEVQNNTESDFEVTAVDSHRLFSGGTLSQ